MLPYPEIIKKLYIYATRKRQAAPERLLQTHLTFSKSVMVCMAVSKFGPMDRIFINARVKINGAYYRDVLPTQKLLPVVREICGEFFTFQQASWHRFEQSVIDNAVDQWHKCLQVNLCEKKTL